MRISTWKRLNHIQWKSEAHKEYLKQGDFTAILEKLKNAGHLSTTFDNRREWMEDGTYRYEIRGYWDHLYIGGKKGVRHLISHRYDDAQNLEANKLGYIPDTGRKSNTIEQRIFKELNGVTERDAFGYSDPQLNKCVPKQLYYINQRWVNKKITCAGKADFSSHYPASICGSLPDWKKHKIAEGTVEPTSQYPFVFYTRSGHLAEYKTFDTHYWRDEELSGDLFGANYTKVNPDRDLSIICAASEYRLDSTIEFLYNKKQLNEDVDGLPAKTVLNASIGYKHLRGAHNTRNRLYHLAAVCIARANQKMIDLFNDNRKSILQIIVDGIIYMGSHQLGGTSKSLGALHQEITDQSFIMRGLNQYMFIDRDSGVCSAYAHSGCDFNIQTTRLEDIHLWQRSGKE